MGIRDNGSRYRMRTENLLPKFGSEKNPFGTSPVPEVAKPEPAKVPAAVAKAPKPEPVKAEPVKLVTHSLFEPQPATAVPLVAPVAVVEAVSVLHPEPVNPAQVEPVRVAPARVEPQVTRPVALPAKKRVPLAAWARKLNPLAYLPARTSGAKPAKSRVTRAPVQTELSLERVRVMRNDLSDADLEVVPARPVKLAAKPAAPPAQPASRAEPVTAGEPTTWNRLTSRFFGARETTQIR